LSSSSSAPRSWDDKDSNGLSIADLTRKHGAISPYPSRLIKLNFLAPAILEAILTGMHPQTHIEAETARVCAILRLTTMSLYQ
jgi:hypothetical protein